MKHHRHSRAEIQIKALEARADLSAGLSEEQIARKQGISLQTLRRWLRDQAVAEAERPPRLRQLELENRMLRKAIEDLETDKRVLAEAIRGNF